MNRDREHVAYRHRYGEKQSDAAAIHPGSMNTTATAVRRIERTGADDAQQGEPHERQTNRVDDSPYATGTNR